MKPEARSAGPGSSPVYRVQAIDRAVSILNELGNSNGELSGFELAEKLRLHKSTVHRLVAVLMANGLVERKPGSAKYGLGWRVFELGMVAASRLDFLKRVRPHVARLVELTGETAHFCVLRHNDVVSLVNVESRYTVRTPATVGRSIPLHATAQGKAILAFLPPQQMEEQLKDHVFTCYTANTITGVQRFHEELALVRKRGYALDNEELEEGLRCIAAPVRDYTGSSVGALGIAGPSFRVNGTRLPALSRVIVETAAAFSTDLGYRPAPSPS